jgi:3-hydroxyisobutyrate dehydrogenase-like beta-hydroxyacid dehydrogenase
VSDIAVRVVQENSVRFRTTGDYSPQFPLRLMNKDFGLILYLAATVGARMPATEAAFEVNARQSEQGQEQDFSAVILQMEKQAHLGPQGEGRSI